MLRNKKTVKKYITLEHGFEQSEVSVTEDQFVSPNTHFLTASSVPSHTHNV